ncbi:MAG: cytochrome b/b6 domain-containing protein [Dehalococcoidaceae bacterium]|nr:cytochrome b/b6 domain-containing protein [Dehalococcoidaceae bacterium]
MAKKALILTLLFLATVPLGWYLSDSLGILFFDDAWWLLLVAVGLGTVLGIYSGITRPRERIEGDKVERHGARGFLSHWGTSVGIFVCLGTGIYMGFLFIEPFMKSIADTVLPLNLHFTGVTLLLFAGFFFAFDYLVMRDFDRLVPNLKDLIHGMLGKYFLRRKWHAETKYLSSQKVAALGMASIGAVILLTGAFKVAAHVWEISADVWGWMTLIHDIATGLFILMLIIHVILVLVLKSHWSTLASWVTGKVSRDFVEEHHPIWYEEMTTGKQRAYKPFGYKEDSSEK